jgi:hypothetical protein
VSKRTNGPAPQAGPAPMAPDEYASRVSSRVPEYPVVQPPGPRWRLRQSGKAAPAALYPFAAAAKSGSLAGPTAASVFLARAPAVVDETSAKPACEYVYEYRQSSPADVLRPMVLRMAEEYASRPPVMHPRVMRTKSPVASALAPGSPREVLSNLALACRQTASKRLCRVLRSRFATPEA